MSVFWQVVLIVACVAIVLSVVISRIVARKKGNPTCDCGCSSCAACRVCRGTHNEPKAK